MKVVYLGIILTFLLVAMSYAKPIYAEPSDPVQILNVQVSPNIIQVNNAFSLTMTILNNSTFPIYLTSGSCAPAFSVVFDAHAKQVYPNIACTAEAILQKVDPLSEVMISNANKPGVIYQAVQSGAATVNITLPYYARNQTATDYSNIYYNTSKSFLFPIYDNKANLTIQNYGQKPIVHMIQSPLKQFDSGIAANNIVCTNDLTLVIKAEDSSPACVKSDTASSLVKRGWALPGPKDFGYNPGRGPVTLEKQAPAKFSSLGPDPFPSSTLNRLVFFIKSNSTAQIYVQYTSDFKNTGNVTTGGQGYTGNPDHFIPLNSSQITISSSPDHVSMSQGTNTTVVYDIFTKNVSSGLYWVYLTPICGAMPVAIDMDSSQIIPSDIPVYAEHCGVEVLNSKILGISGGTAEYKLSQELR